MKHYKKKMIECENCDMVFNFKSVFEIHNNGVHLKIKRFYCPTCDLGFYQIGDLNRHVKTKHLKIKRFDCPECDKKFFYKNAVKLHVERVHEFKKDFACDICGNKFNANGDLQRHIKSVHIKQKNHECEHCGWLFYSESNKNTHVLRKHTDPLPVNTTRGEKAVSNALDFHKINYVREKMFSDLKGYGGGYLRYDFAIIVNEEDEDYLLIEFDGKQHFQPVKFRNTHTDEEANEKFKLRKRHDRIKNKYADTHDYPLLRIKYTEIKQVQEIVTEFLNKYTTL